MSTTISRRTLLQWAGGVAAGVLLSPTPFALVDDLTIATQTRGRSARLPRGPRDRIRTRCALCPAGCSVEVLTVGGRPYLTVPAGCDAPACALRPAAHRFALLPERFDTAWRDDRALPTTIAGLEQAARWIDEATARGGAIALLDASRRPAIATPLYDLASALPGARWIDLESDPLDHLGTALGLDASLELAVDPRSVERAVVVRPGRSIAEARRIEDGEDPARTVTRLARTSSSGVVFAEDGAGIRPDDDLVARVAWIDHELGAVGPDRLLLPRRRIEDDLHHGTIADHPPGSLDLLVVDASRPAGAIPWRRLRRKIGRASCRERVSFTV